MADIPSVGILQLDVFDPGLTNIEFQAYPRPLDLAQALALQLGNLIAAGAFAANPPPTPLQSGVLPSEVFAQSQAFAPPSLLQGVAVVQPASVNIGVQNSVRLPVVDFIITEAGSFQTNESPSAQVTLTIAPGPGSPVVGGVAQSVVTTTVGTVTYFQLFLGNSNLNDFGIPLLGSLVLLPNQAPARNPQDVPTRPILQYSTNWILISLDDPPGSGFDSLPINPPTLGQTVTFNVRRTGFEVIFDLFPTESNVIIDAAPPAATTVSATDARRVSNATANDGVVNGFVGGGTRIPLLLFQNLRDSAFYPANQTIATLGLPANVNIG